MGRTGNQIKELATEIAVLQAKVNRFVSCQTHSNLRIHMIESWITDQSEQPSAMIALVQYIKAIVPPTELARILKGEAIPPEVH